MELKVKEPKVRFGEFTGKWEECRFNEIYKKINEKNDLSFGPDKIISVANMYYKPMRDSTKSKIDYMKTYNIMRVGDIAFEGNKSKSYSYGRFVENIIGDGIVSHVFDVFRPITSYDIFFWKYYINNENIMGHVLRRVTTKATMMTNLVAKDFLKAKIYVPSIDEQKRIGLFLKQIDSIITLHQQELEQLKESKKTLLSKMFPKEGVDRPEIRFAGFTDPWEQRKFSETFNFPISTNSLSRAMLNYDRGEVKSIHYGDVLIKYPSILDIRREEIPFITNGTLEKYKANLLVNGDLIFADAAEDETVGKAVEIEGITDENIVSGLHTIVARANQHKAQYFLGYYINSDIYHRQLLRLMQGSKVSAISKGNLQKTKVIFPKDIGEQQKIGDFFKKFDTLITLHQQELETLKALKKTLLNLMFV
jgi:type I restriction enzyme S subunit